MTHGTDTEAKLREAAAQMRLAIANARDDVMFTSCINGFVSAARSITMVMERESKRHQDLHAWYKERTAALAKNDLCQFFKEQRNLTIHRGDFGPSKTTIPITRIEFGPGDQRSISGTSGGKPPAQVGDVLHTTGLGTIIVWTFPAAAEHLPGRSPNVLRLCEDYFVMLKGLVGDWLRRREALRLSTRR